MANSPKNVDRRGFLKGAAAAGIGAPIALAQQTTFAAKPETSTPVEVTSNQRPGSDFMVDVIKSLGIEYCAAIPAPVSAAFTSRW
jgi:hypothetical protein